VEDIVSQERKQIIQSKIESSSFMKIASQAKARQRREAQSKKAKEAISVSFREIKMNTDKIPLSESMS
jgi:hypothetical protein